MKILLTGGNGFIGKNLYEQLHEKYTILAPNKEELDLLNTTNVENYIKNNKFDVIINTAIYNTTAKNTTKNPNLVLENNLKMYFNIERCKQYFGKLINLGSGAEYGRENWQSFMPENYINKHIPTDQYGLSKYIISKNIENNKDFYNLRLFAVYGKYEDYGNRFISNVICRKLLNLPIIINKNVFFTFTYIDDIINIIDWFIINKYALPARIFNVCDNVSNSLMYIAKLIGGNQYPIQIKENGIGNEYSGSNNLLINTIGNYKFVSLIDGIDKMFEYYTKNIKNIDINLL